MLNSSPTQPVRPVQPGQPVRTDPQSEAYRANLRAQQRRTLYTFSQLVWLAFGVLEGLIGLRIVLRLMAANPANPFAHLIMAVPGAYRHPAGRRRGARIKFNHRAGRLCAAVGARAALAVDPLRSADGIG